MSTPSISPTTTASHAPVVFANAVFEGGGVRDIAHVGALTVAEQLGYRWQYVAGTSAGAIIASLVAAGYTAPELYTIMHTIDYRQFALTPTCDPLHITNLLQLLTHNGLYSSSYIETFVREKLAAKGIHTFGDLRVSTSSPNTNPATRYHLTVIASDITHGQLLRLPQDVHCFGLDPDALDVAFAVRMSASIPFFFEPVTLMHPDGSNSCIVDGGLLSNYPLFLFEQPGIPPAIPTLGFRLVASPDDTTSSQPQTPRTTIELGKALLDTMLSAHDKLYIEDTKYVRTIAIPVNGISTTQFDLTVQQAQHLYENGIQAAQTFFNTWDFEAYKRTYGDKSISSSARITHLHKAMKSL